MKNSYLEAEAGAASVVAGATAAVSAGAGATVAGVASVAAVVSVEVVVDSSLLQAANEAAITKTPKSFFMFLFFLILFKQ
jgi:hypothetical protein